MDNNSFSIKIAHSLYTGIVRLYGWGIRIYSLWNNKARSWVEGRRNWQLSLIKIRSPQDKIIIFHAASLGEAEQGLPIIKSLKNKYPQYKVGMSFFSPSGFENFKDPSPDFKCYLPLDTPSNAVAFVKILKPELMVFIKYEVWFNLIKELQHNNIPVVLAPAIFRESQWYFHSLFKKFALTRLRRLDAILVQDQRSAELLQANFFENVSICGDTRIDRVLEIAESTYFNDILNHFSDSNKITLIAGSTWPQDEKLIHKLSIKFPELKIIIAPHDLSKEHLEEIKNTFGKDLICYSNYRKDTAWDKILLIDNVGLLSRIYRFGDIAYIGGGFGVGVHNTLEAAAYGMPVIFGPNHKKFIEPSGMIELGFGHEIFTEKDLMKIMVSYLQNPQKLKSDSQNSAKYIQSKAGAGNIILEKISQLLPH